MLVEIMDVVMAVFIVSMDVVFIFLMHEILLNLILSKMYFVYICS